MKSIIKKLMKDFSDWRMLRRGLTVKEQIKVIKSNDSKLLKKVILRQKLSSEALDVFFHAGYKPREDSLGYIYHQRYGLDNKRMLRIISGTDVSDMGLPKTLIRQFNLFYSGCTPEQERDLVIFLLSNDDDEVMDFFINLEKTQDILRSIDLIGVNNKYSDVIAMKKAAFERNFSKMIPKEKVQRKILETKQLPLILLAAKELRKVEAWYWGHLNERRRFLIEEFDNF